MTTGLFGLINGGMFTNRYLAAIRNLWLARFRFAIYAFSCKNPRRQQTHILFQQRKNYYKLTFLFVPLYFKVPQRYETGRSVVFSGYYGFLQSEIPLSSDDIIYYCQSRRTSERNINGKQLICLTSSGSAHFHVSWLSDFINYQKPLYKSLHQSFFYSFITILPSESGVTLHYSTILPQIL